MSDHPEPLSFDLVSVSPEEQERHALRLPRLELAQTSTVTWIDWKSTFGVNVQLPPEFSKEEKLDLPDHAWWQAESGSMFLLTRHEGGGNVNTMIGFDAEPASYNYEGSFHTRMVGRVVAVSLSQFRHEDHFYYYAAGDAGVASGVGVGFAIMAVSAHERDLLLNSLATIRIEKSDVESGA